MAIKYIPSCPNIFQTDMNYTKIPTFSTPMPPKYTQIGIFGKKIYHLATQLHHSERLPRLPSKQ
jgi:hypothetical protein